MFIKLRILIVSISFFNSFYSQNISTDRPSNTDNSSTLNRNLLQLETGVLKSNLFQTNPKEINYTIPTVLLRYGLSENIEIRVLEEFGFSKFVPDTFGIVQQTKGINSFEVGTKLQIFKKKTIHLRQKNKKLKEKKLFQSKVVGVL